MSSQPQNAYAVADINIGRIVIRDNSHNNACKQAVNATVVPFGISGNGGRSRPDPSFAQSDVDVAAKAGESVPVFGGGSVAVDCYCNYAWSPGDPIKSDGSGKGVVATTGDFIVGFAQTGGTVDALCPVDVWPMKI